MVLLEMEVCGRFKIRTGSLITTGFSPVGGFAEDPKLHHEGWQRSIPSTIETRWKGTSLNRTFTIDSFILHRTDLGSRVNLVD